MNAVAARARRRPRRNDPGSLKAFVCVVVLFPGSAGANDVGFIHLKNAKYTVHEGPPAARAIEFDEPEAPGRWETWIVAIEGPADPIARREIESAGAKVAGWIPSTAYLIRGTTEVAERLRTLSVVARVDRFEPAWKIAPGLEDRTRAHRVGVFTGDEAFWTADIFEGESVARVADQVRAAGIDVVQVWETDRVRRIVVRGSGSEQADRLAAIPEIEWVEDLPFVRARNDTVRWVIQSNVPNQVPLYAHGLLGAGQILGIIDAPVSLASCFFLDPNVALPGPTHRKLVSYHSSTGFGANGHGTHVAGIAAGDREPTDGTILTRGMAPKARIAFTNYADVDGSGNSVSNLDALLTQDHADGARVHTNSWGEDGRSDYVTWCRDIDNFTRVNEDDLVLFAVSNTSNLGVPENAKNVLAVGATQRPPNQEFIGLAGAGPTLDGRRKPEVFAPGVSTISASTATCATATSTGTSMASPAVAGGAALVREYLVRGFYPTGTPRATHAFTPTGALLKAMVVNSCRDLTGSAGYPGAQEGWGRLCLDDVLYFPGEPERLWIRDVRHVQGLSTGETDTYVVRVVDSAPRLRITLAFNDQPAALGANPASVNDLDLEVEGPGGLFLGNVFNTITGLSVTGGVDDPKNNVERVILASPSAGTWTLRVHGESVPLGPQGYALAVNGGLFPAVPGDALSPDERSSTEDSTLRGTSLGTTVELSSPRPNPFSTITTYRVALPSSSPIRLAIYDVAGRQVRLLLDRALDAGEYEILWDGRTDEGGLAPAGIYFARLTAPGVDRRVKGVLLR